MGAMHFWYSSHQMKQGGAGSLAVPASEAYSVENCPLLAAPPDEAVPAASFRKMALRCQWELVAAEKPVPLPHPWWEILCAGNVFQMRASSSCHSSIPAHSHTHLLHAAVSGQMKARTAGVECWEVVKQIARLFASSHLDVFPNVVLKRASLLLKSGC